MHSAKLVALTNSDPINMKQKMSAEEFIIYCARVSNPDNQWNNETAPQLLRSLVRRGHWSPLEMASATIEIVTTRDIARQILRHRSFSFQEFSQRYGAVQSFEVSRETRFQDHKNRQSSIDIDAANDEHIDVNQSWREKQQEILQKAREVYEWALAEGIAKEQARCVLPEGLTLSKLYMAGTMRSWYHYLVQRTDPATQKEHRQVAQSCLEALAPSFPNLFGKHSTFNTNAVSAVLVQQ